MKVLIQSKRTTKEIMLAVCTRCVYYKGGMCTNEIRKCLKEESPLGNRVSFTGHCDTKLVGEYLYIRKV